MSETVRSEPTPHEVAAYLRRHPRFLSQFPDLALSLVVPRDEGQATSLASYQLEVLRDKNRELNRRLHELYTNAEDNERLAVRTHQQALRLMRAGSATESLRCMVANLIEDFASDLVRVLLFAPVEGLDAGATDWLAVVPANDVGLLPFRDFLAAAEPLCGRVHSDKLDLLFAARAGEVQSVALLPLGGRGLLAIGSHDANRFFPGMGTLFLRMMADSLDAALDRYPRSAQTA
jgi:uncharacterized protein